MEYVLGPILVELKPIPKYTSPGPVILIWTTSWSGYTVMEFNTIEAPNGVGGAVKLLETPSFSTNLKGPPGPICGVEAVKVSLVPIAWMVEMVEGAVGNEK